MTWLFTGACAFLFFIVYHMTRVIADAVLRRLFK
nr:MAG TPA: hypothetical protein [Caudoviricetes sp.]